MGRSSPLQLFIRHLHDISGLDAVSNLLDAPQNLLVAYLYWYAKQSTVTELRKPNMRYF